MKKRLLPLFLGAIATLSLGASIMSYQNTDFARADEPEISEPAISSSEETSEATSEETSEETPVLTGYVTLGSCSNGEISADKLEGNVGDIITITAKHDMFYVVQSVTVNGNALIESETTSGVFTFVLVEGENLVTATFVIDQALLGDLTTIYEQAKNKDWTNLFTIDNVLIIVKWVLDCGILVALIRYYVKDKKLEKKLEDKVQSVIGEIIPDTTKDTVIKTVQTVVTPIFTELGGEMATITKAMSVFAECLALAQENTPEARLAIIQNLKSLNLGDEATINGTKKYIENLVSRSEKAYRETIAALEKITQKNQEIVEDNQNKNEEIF